MANARKVIQDDGSLAVSKVPDPAAQHSARELVSHESQLAASALLNLTPPIFTCARKDASGQKKPQIIGHRGCKAKCPENTILSFATAFADGAHAIETDVHLSRDGEVVLSHDATLKRCFGLDQKIVECEWSYLSTLRTKREPPEPMPRLVDLLKYISSPELREKWVLLDIKVDNDAGNLMRQIARAIKSVPEVDDAKWKDRILLGCWTAKYLPLAQEYLPGFPVANISFSTFVSRMFLAIPNVSFNMLQATLVSPWGQAFIREVKAHQRQIYAWTVNDAKTMDWCIRHELDGVITDDPGKFLAVCVQFQEAEKPKWSVRVLANTIRVNLMTSIYGFVFWGLYGLDIDEQLVAKKKKAKD